MDKRKGKEMIRYLEIKKPDIAKQVLAIQIPSYQVEADLIGFAGIPPLRDTLESLQHCGEIFIGYFFGEELTGAVSYQLNHEIVDIHRLVVHPKYFRKGIGNALVTYLLINIAEDRKVIVRTGAKNNPAKALYKKLGFVEKRELEVEKGFFLTEFEK
ncbi:GNAT family N-acetyltransferase [Cytobacillus sp. Hz8]|uniref:GNAT family N-acetyltransferase n=1 Tax=Cytobacillus sp. Hz8 TaxID=3347168 RepID=UPI0035E18CE7